MNNIIQQPLAAQPAPEGLPLLRLGFRPFYVGAALFAVVAMVSWYAIFLGQMAPAS
ncbi:MAG TPA: NnrS family protein, partial [Ramlibacter sp.]|nr:NnrS family protein [Ramlibacter sp.]